MSRARKCGAKTDERDARGRFAAGNPGKPPGTRHKVTRAAEKLLEQDAEALTQKAVALALAGDTVALRLCIDRLVPPRRPGDRPLEVGDLPENPGAAMSAILGAVSCGDLLLGDAERLAALVRVRADMLTVSDLEARLAALEETVR